MLEDRRVKEERRDLDRLQRREFGKLQRRLRSERLKRDICLLAFAGSNEGNRTLMCWLRRILMKTFVKLRRDREANGEKKSREQTTSNDGAETLAAAHARRKMDLTVKVSKSFPFRADRDAGNVSQANHGRTCFA